MGWAKILKAVAGNKLLQKPLAKVLAIYIKRRLDMLSGYRTYIALIALVLNNVLKYMGFTEFAPEEVTNALNVLLAIIAFFFRYKATVTPTK